MKGYWDTCAALARKLIRVSISSILFASAIGFFCENDVSASDFFDRLWYGGAVGVGYQSLTSSSKVNTSKSGFLFQERALLEYRSEFFGILGVGLGGQQTIQEGSTTARLQQLTISTFLFELSYLYPIYKDNISIGGIVSNQWGSGSRFNFGDLQTPQLLTGVGPQIRYNYHAKSFDIIGGAMFLTAMNSPGQSIWSVPVYAGILFRFGHEPKPSSSRPNSERAPASIESKEEPEAKKQNELREAVSCTPCAVQGSPDFTVTITFSYRKSKLNDAALKLLDQVASSLQSQQDNWKSIEIVGHTDPRGSLHYNLGLSKRRATRVHDRLVEKGVSARRLMIGFFGKQQPIPGLDKTARAHRRVVLTIRGVIDMERLHQALLNQLTKT